MAHKEKFNFAFSRNEVKVMYPNMQKSNLDMYMALQKFVNPSKVLVSITEGESWACIVSEMDACSERLDQFEENSDQDPEVILSTCNALIWDISKKIGLRHEFTIR